MEAQNVTKVKKFGSIIICGSPYIEPYFYCGSVTFNVHSKKLQRFFVKIILIFIITPAHHILALIEYVFNSFLSHDVVIFLCLFRLRFGWLAEVDLSEVRFFLFTVLQI
jgi:hypothetical protein